jgi:GNAT superfamily N-acetyltransferase
MAKSGLDRRRTDALIIRVAEAAEQATLEALQWRASLNNPGDRAALLANPDAIELPLDQISAGGVFVAEQDGVIAGFAAVLMRRDGQAELDALFVEPTVWRSGVGRSLVEHCLEYADVQGAAILHVVGNPHAKEFYAACGFEFLGEHQTRFGAGITMRKKI